jgi:hypothetical protein
MDNDDQLKAVAEIQGKVIEMRRMAAETTDLRERDACLRVADAIERGLANWTDHKRRPSS